MWKPLILLEFNCITKFELVDEIIVATDSTKLIIVKAFNFSKVKVYDRSKLKMLKITSTTESIMLEYINYAN